MKTNSKTECSPECKLPWKALKTTKLHDDTDSRSVIQTQGIAIDLFFPPCVLKEEAEIVVEKIVRAVNSFEALKLVIQEMIDMREKGHGPAGWDNRAKAALKLAQEGELK